MARSCIPATSLAPKPAHPLERQLQRLTLALHDENRLLNLCQTLALEGNYPRAPHCYSRTILYRDPQGAEVMVARWDDGARSPIHGHPELTFVLVLEGKLRVENFKGAGGTLERTDTLHLGAGQHIWNRGTAGHFDNAIHRVTALEPSLSLHIYSDDALKGHIY